MNKFIFIPCLFIVQLLCSLNVYAKVYMVDNPALFNTAQEHAQSGDTILWRPGSYKDSDLSIDKDSLVFMAQEPGKTIFSGASKLIVRSDHIEISGFQFLKGNIGTGWVIEVLGSHNVFSEINIQDYFCNKYFVIGPEARYNKVVYCNFENKLPFDRDQNVLSVLVDPHQPGYNQIRYCAFKNFPGTGGDMGVEPIRIGLSTQGKYISRTLVEYCYFTQCDGDGEIISHKSRQNIYRYNTFDHNTKAELVLRHGRESLVYGNFFLNGMGGIRVKEGQQHYIFNNYFQNLEGRAIWLMNYQVDPLDSVLIAFNTIVNCESVRLGGSGDYPPQNINIANNIFSNPKSQLFSDATGEESWTGNIAFGTLGIAVPISGFAQIDPHLRSNNEGFYTISSNSMAIDAAQNGYYAIPHYPGMDAEPVMGQDIMQQSRPDPIGSKDVGCSEYHPDVFLRPHVDETNTGPHYLR